MTKNDAVERAINAMEIAIDFIRGKTVDTTEAYNAVRQAQDGLLPLLALQTIRPDAGNIDDICLKIAKRVEKQYGSTLMYDARNIIAEEIRAALQSGDKGRWMPIESAPRDGTEIIILEEIGNIASAVCAERKDIWVSPDGAYGYEPIMWMPRNALPAQPTSEGM